MALMPKVIADISMSLDSIDPDSVVELCAMAGSSRPGSLRGPV
jgi:hypothetical protein